MSGVNTKGSREDAKTRSFDLINKIAVVLLNTYNSNFVPHIGVFMKTSRLRGFACKTVLELAV